MTLYRIKGCVMQPRPFDMLVNAEDEQSAVELAQDGILDDLSIYFTDDDGSPVSFEFTIRRVASDADLIELGALPGVRTLRE